MIETYVLSSGDARSWTLFPIAALRIAKFAKEYDSDANVQMLVSHLKQNFVHPDGPALIILALDDGVVVGHLFATMEEWFGTPFATVVQYELDRAIPAEQRADGLEMVENWARVKGAAFLQCLARNDVVARAFSVSHGFDRNRIIMRKALSADVAPSVEIT